MSFRLLGTSCLSGILLSGILLVLVPCTAAETAPARPVHDRVAAAARNQEAQDTLGLVQSVIFAVRPYGPDPHYYANFGYYCADPTQKAYPEGGRLCRLDVLTDRVTLLLDDPRGGVRDPHMHYDGCKVLFSYRPGGTENYHLYEIGVDGQGLQQLTDGPFDDIEPTYLPDGDIVFCSSRCSRERFEDASDATSVAPLHRRIPVMAPCWPCSGRSARSNPFPEFRRLLIFGGTSNRSWIGSSASKLMTRIDGSHYDVAVTPQEAKLVRLWLDSGAVANGTYAIMDGGTPENPSPHYVREMKRYGILSPQTQEPIDVYAADEAYWRSFWYQGLAAPGSDQPD